MPTAPTHVLTALALGAAAAPRPVGRRVLVVAVACALLPDVDVIGFHLGLPYGHVLGHRGLSHSLPTAAVVAVAAVAAFFRGPASFGRRLRIGLLLFVVTASHGVLDSMTDGGRGIAFLAPFTSKRFFSPWQPLHVSPLDLGGFFGRGGFEALRTEAIWIWLPAAGLVAGAALARRARRTDPRGGAAAGGPP